jgi:23S rRNA (guanosine2251-2'-O)-methyltransferase
MSRPPRRTSGPSSFTPSEGPRRPSRGRDDSPARPTGRGRESAGEAPDSPRGPARGGDRFADRAPRRDDAGAPQGRFRGERPERPHAERPRPEHNEGGGRFADRAPRRDDAGAPQGRFRPEHNEGGSRFADRAPRQEGRPGFRRDDAPAPRGRFQPEQGERPAGRFAPRQQGGFQDRPQGRGFDRAPELDVPPPPPRLSRPPRDQEMAAPNGSLWLYGQHAVAAALANPKRRVRRLLLTADAEATLAETLPPPWRIPAERVEKNRFQTFLTEDAVHQGAALLADPLPPADLEDALAASNGPVLLLDQVTDPRNVGAILRSAAAFGAAAVVMQDRNAPPETAALARTASGALEIVPVVREVNLSRTIVTLQKAGFWVMGLDGSAKRELAEAKPTDRRVALVLGAEDTGLRRLQRETCDELVRLPIVPEVESLNVSAAATVALYELARKA